MSSIRIQHTPDGTPYVRAYLGRSPITGKPVRPYKEFPGMTDEQAQAAAREFVAHARESLGSKDTLQVQLSLYLDNSQAHGKHAANSLRKYRGYVRNYVAPVAGMRVADVTPETIDTLTKGLIERGWRDRPLSRDTVRSFQQFMRGAFNYFVGLQLTDRNPVVDSMRIRPSRQEVQPIDEGSLVLIRDWIAKEMEAEVDLRHGVLHRNAAMGMLLALKTGMRVGEVCALRRRDVWLYQHTVSINGTMVDGRRQGTTKSKQTRNISIADSDVDELRRFMRWQDETYLPAAGQTTPLLTVDGSHMTTSSLEGQFRRMQRETGIAAHYRFHDLRHAHVTYLLRQGADMRSISERLGHSDVTITMRTYSHLLAGRDRELANAFDEVWHGI